METHVVWLNLDAGSAVRGYWDQGLLELLFDGKIGRTRRSYVHHEVRHEDEMPSVDGAVVVVPGRFHVEKIARLARALERLTWVVLIVSSDEESLFDVRGIEHPRIRRWVMTPDPAKTYDEDIRFLGEGYAADTPALLAALTDRGKPVDVAFLGQITHERREIMSDELRGLSRRGDLTMRTLFSEGFTQGVSREEYLAALADAKIAPAPAGPATADSFRFFEALEAGCIPVADARSEGKPAGYWDRLFAGLAPRPWPTTDSWRVLPAIVDEILPDWKPIANACSAWWQYYKRDLRRSIENDIDAVSEISSIDERNVADALTVIVTASPIPSNPSTEIIDETLASIQERLPGVEVIVAIDGCRPELAATRGDAYEEFIRRFLADTNLHRSNVLPVVLSEHVHQAGATRAALDFVQTPTVLFVEHDTPLLGEIPFREISDVVASGEANLVRLHHEANVLEPHQYLMIDDEPREIFGVPLLATAQWSQRPHVASTAFYRDLLARYFGSESKTMIEDAMHGVLQAAWRDGAWGMFRVFMYAPPGDMKRSTHLDGRAGDPKFEMIFAYDTEQPRYAPGPTPSPVHRQPGTPDDDRDRDLRVDPPVPVLPGETEDEPVGVADGGGTV